MKLNLPLPTDKKLTVIHRIEPGCLGPSGAEHVVAFCKFAEQELTELDANFIQWKIEPRFDKSRPEVQFQLANKQLNYAQATKYLSVFDKDIEEFEDHYNQMLMHLIEEYFERT